MLLRQNSVAETKIFTKILQHTRSDLSLRRAVATCCCNLSPSVYQPLMYGASDGVRYLVVPFGLEQATFFGANVKRFLLRSVIPTSLVVPAYTFFSLIAVHRMALLWCMEQGDNLVHPPLPIQRERASRVLHNCCGVLCFPLHHWLATREKHFTHNHNSRKKWCYTTGIYGHDFRLFRCVLKIGHLIHKHIFCQKNQYL